MHLLARHRHHHPSNRTINQTNINIINSILYFTCHTFNCNQFRDIKINGTNWNSRFTQNMKSFPIDGVKHEIAICEMGC